MTTDVHSHPNYTAVWLWLMGLAILAVAASRLDLQHALATLIIYGTAGAKALLVALYFMHLKKERLLILVLVLTPLVLFVILLVALLPDFVLRGNLV